MASVPDHLAGHLLLAHPGLRDPNFRRGIIHLVEHDDDQGTLGFILNRPTGQTLGDLAEERLSPHMAAIPVYLGGPVAPRQIIVARLQWDEILEELTFSANLDPESLPDIAASTQGELRAFLGYSGWGENQLADELKQNAWMVHGPHPATLTANTATWKKLLGDFGPQYRLLAEQPDDPTLN